MEDDEVVTSEVHLGCPPHEVSCLSIFTIASSPRTFDDGEKPQTFREQCIPRVICSLNEEVSSSDNFDISTNSSLSDRSVISVDECGDLVIPRRNRNYHAYGDIQESTISIYHHVKTTLSRVGLQIWKASLLLGDFLLHKIQTTDELAGVVGIELGAGTGILGILLAAKARVVFLTDLDTEVLDNCLRNVILNSRKSKKIDSSIRIRQLDWKQPWPPIDETPDVENSIENKSLLVCLYPVVNLLLPVFHIEIEAGMGCIMICMISRSCFLYITWKIIEDVVWSRIGQVPIKEVSKGFFESLGIHPLEMYREPLFLSES
ncbi:hypothetical protein KP509_35G066600 [Ceratopteris richardii]|uniref:Methyltransferase-like protein 22 n=1 Tax=Ceratopteris richardii TaxID=49495 RepID=A0A8T2QGF6_CERRI|nr:hypothetical protein KP509_35G066600 [Ceratopteris richardii]